ncbi:Two-component system response regulator DccR [hydrothermal vent metagenome]|uniref:Two-component system response regulator DccR n=1 Tax=hydrothermal vent metagenome TaxID=652676 RepID=A0A1W1D4W6_9ZZZZ
MLKILLLEDDSVLSETLIELLEGEGFEVYHVVDGQKALDVTFSHQFDFFLFDVNVAYVNGFELLQSLREAGVMTPAIFITALSDIASLSYGFSVGADDYIKKPFDFDELLVRISALLRKSYHSYMKEIMVDDFRFFIEKEELYQGEEFIALSPYELKITKLLFQNLNATVQKELILEHLSEGREMSEASLRVHINKLRKIGLPIITIKGIGYRLASS